ncbi:ATP-grasp domain-containing protein [Actinokineospora alba]|uniref:ATP-grasp domain-containing protein n=1 Tax=Actinokineospora alba TaxID=504798 RepID=A0A1H0EMK9_9PSEU|nr:ATP-grasp domain-containing protein [Actinokineospora alba]TDP69139.1 ATP-grasp domain-containing protein [Actinokineospora alba]SDI23468.1 ATP-grasp domain-containing protein [Actinokineospora alba]SDN83580.1 ATP-grasp domain-containing protein [Actinokineospora alba]
MSKTIAMVDVYAPTLALAEAFIAAGATVVRVQSTVDAPPVYGSHPDLAQFADNIVHEGDFDATRDAVAKHRPDIVITGGETGVELADQLSAALGLVTNGTRHSEARRNKFAQNETLRAAGLRSTRQLLVSDEEQLRAWHSSFGGRVVVKPIRSAGNDGVTFCDTPGESVDAFRAISGRTNIFAVRNEGVVAQEYLTGTEFAVNTVSCAGKHRVTDIWRYAKMTVNGVVDRHSGVFSAPVDEQPEVVEYAFAVLAALGVDYGPAHLEIMMTQDGPCLVEAGIRLCGAGAAHYAKIAGGESQLEWAVDAYLEPERFVAEYQRPHRVDQHVVMAFLTSPVEGVLESYPLLDQVRQLPSFHKVHMGVQPGQPLAKTVDDCTEPMMIGLAHPVAQVVADDFRAVNYLDGHGFYRVAQP